MPTSRDKSELTDMDEHNVSSDDLSTGSRGHKHTIDELDSNCVSTINKNLASADLFNFAVAAEALNIDQQFDQAIQTRRFIYKNKIKARFPEIETERKNEFEKNPESVYKQQKIYHNKIRDHVPYLEEAYPDIFAVNAAKLYESSINTIQWYLDKNCNDAEASSEINYVDILTNGQNILNGDNEYVNGLPEVVKKRIFWMTLINQPDTVEVDERFDIDDNDERWFLALMFLNLGRKDIFKRLIPSEDTFNETQRNTILLSLISQGKYCKDEYKFYYKKWKNSIIREFLAFVFFIGVTSLSEGKISNISILDSQQQLYNLFNSKFLQKCFAEFGDSSMHRKIFEGLSTFEDRSFIQSLLNNPEFMSKVIPQKFWALSDPLAYVLPTAVASSLISDAIAKSLFGGNTEVSNVATFCGGIGLSYAVDRVVRQRRQNEFAQQVNHLIQDEGIEQNEIDTLHEGIEASRGWMPYLRSFTNPTAWSNASTFNAGLVAGYNGIGEDLKKIIKDKRKPD